MILAALSRLGLVPDRPDAVGIAGIADQERGGVGIERIGEGLENGLGIRLAASFDTREAGVGEAAEAFGQAGRDLLERQLAVLAPFADEMFAAREAAKTRLDFTHTERMCERTRRVHSAQRTLPLDGPCTPVVQGKQMHLSDYMAARGLSDEQVASELGCSRPTVSRIRRRLCRPDWSTLLALDKFSYGAVTANDFLHLEAKSNGGRRGRKRGRGSATAS